MGKRFGRNQKRALKQELQNYKRANDMNCNLLAYATAERQKLQSQLDRVAKILGADHVALPVRNSTLKITDPNFRGLYFAEKKQFVDFFNESQSPTLKLSRQEMFALIVRVAEDADKNAIHTRVQLADGNMAYSVSREAIDMIPESQLKYILIEEITRQISEALAKVLKNQ